MRPGCTCGTLYIKVNRRWRAPAKEIAIRGTLDTGRRTGRSLPEIFAQAWVAGGGKSELRRAVCRITSGTRASRPVDGQCHREHTAQRRKPLSKGEKVR